MSDDSLSRELTDLLRGVPGVVDVFDAHPVVEGAVRVVAAGLPGVAALASDSQIRPSPSLPVLWI